MTTETILEVKPNKTIIPLTFDRAFICVFNKEKNISILEHFISTYLKLPLEKVKGHLKLLSRDLELDHKQERQKQIDILLDLDGRKINIELNNNNTAGILERNIVFASKIHGRQLKKSDNDYSKIEQTIQINLNNFSCNETNLIESYYLTNEEGKRLSEKLRIDFVDIAKATKKRYNESEEELARWLRILTSTTLEELERELGEDLMDNDSKDKLLEEVERYSEDDEMIAMYSYYTKEELEKNTMLIEAKQEGIKEGKIEGIKERNVEIAKSMLNKGMDITTISEITGLTKEEIEKL